MAAASARVRSRPKRLARLASQPPSSRAGPGSGQRQAALQCRPVDEPGAAEWLVDDIDHHLGVGMSAARPVRRWPPPAAGCARRPRACVVRRCPRRSRRPATAAPSSASNRKPPCPATAQADRGQRQDLPVAPGWPGREPGAGEPGQQGGFAAPGVAAKRKSSQWLASSARGRLCQFTERLAALAPVVFQPGPALAQLALQAPLLLEEAELGGRRFGRGSALSTAPGGPAARWRSRRRRPGDAARRSSAHAPQRPWNSRSRPRSNRECGRCSSAAMSVFSSAKGPTSSAGFSSGCPWTTSSKPSAPLSTWLSSNGNSSRRRRPRRVRSDAGHLGRSQVAEAEAGQVGAEQLAEDHPAGPGRQVDAQGLRGLIRHRLVPQAVALEGDRRC